MLALLSPARRPRLVGVALGLCLAAGFLSVTRVTAGADGLGAEMRMSASPTGELSVSPRGAPFLSAIDLRPGGHAGGRLLVGNQTNVALAVELEAERSSEDLDDQMHLRVVADGVVTADVTLGELSDGWRALMLPSGHQADVTFEASLVPGAGRYQGRLVDVELRLSVEPVGS